MKTALIIHGHFYQPPREDPFTGTYPMQSSAEPYSDWNEAVFKTCYEPNAYSRYLKWDGRIEEIFNNYENISFNFGPTLLKWIDEKHPSFIKKLIEADKKSIRKWGHSNIIAQTYNHTILPLESNENKRIQIEWAKEDYSRRFGHDPEGFWCAECAIDEETVDILSECGIKFVILSPWQAKTINGVELRGEGAPYDRPFILKGKTKSVSAFFYNGDFASGISFGHLLRDADALYKNITSFREGNNNPALLSWATDGEIYGHHEPFGDMALAALVKKVNDGDEFYLTNYAAYLEEHPAEEEATLYLGEDGLGSSWSCSHGVKRWYTDCGCHTGGSDSWNQKWREPLRIALKNLEIKARGIYSSEVKKIFGEDFDTEEMLSSYGKVLSGRISAEDFVKDYASTNRRTLSKTDISRILKLLNAIKNVFFSFTSCGWFFNDITGIEPSQNIKYAFFAAQTLEQFTNDKLISKLLSDLDLAKSNIAGTGRTIARPLLNEVPAEIKACGIFGIRVKLYKNSDDFNKKSGFFRLQSVNNNIFTILNTETLESTSYAFYERSFSGRNNVQMMFRNVKTGAEYYTNLSGFNTDFLQEIAISLDRDIVSNYTVQSINNLSSSMEKYLTVAQLKKDVIKQISIKENLIIFIKSLYSNSFSSERIDCDLRLNYIRSLTKLVLFVGNKETKASMDEFFNYIAIVFSSELGKNELTDNKALYFLGVLDIATSNGFCPKVTGLQNTIWSLMNSVEERKISKETFEKIKYQLNFC